MHRRDFLGLSAAATSSLLLGGETISWSPTVNGLRLGLRVDSHQRPRNLLAVFENLGIEPLDLFVAVGQVHRIEFMAITPDRRMLKIEDAGLYRPCTGLCDLSITERLPPGETRQFTLSADKQLYIPPKGKFTTLDVLLESCLVQASFEVTTQQMQEAGRPLKNAWLGRLTTPEIRA